MKTETLILTPERQRPGLRDALRLRAAAVVLDFFIRDAQVNIRIRNPEAVLTVGRTGGQVFTMTVENIATLWDIIAAPDPRLGETFMDGEWQLRRGDLGRFLTMLAENAQRFLRGRMGGFFARRLQAVVTTDPHTAAQSRTNVIRHYDLGNDLYRLFLDEGMNYSCAFFTAPGMDLRAAQLAKIHAVINRLDIRGGMRVLDIGCGWGEAAVVVARETGASVTGITLAENQFAIARNRAVIYRDSGALSFALEDYREHAATHKGAYDRIYSIGMFEHVGADSYRSYFAAIRDQLSPGGRALVHSIVNAGAMTAHGKLSSLWLERYIFPGGEICNLQDMLDAAAAEGLVPFAPPYMEPSSSYAETLRWWRMNFLRNMDRLDPERYDERFRRMWLFYLCLCEAMFDGCGFQVTQVVFRRAEDA